MLLNILNIYADVDAISMAPSRNTRSYTLRSVPSSPGRSFLLKPDSFVTLPNNLIFFPISLDCQLAGVEISRCGLFALGTPRLEVY